MSTLWGMEMSGGKYNYLCYHTDEIMCRRETLEKMTQDLESVEWAAGIVTANKLILLMLDTLKIATEDMQEEWHAIEWWQSGDWSEERARGVTESRQRK